MKDSKLPSFSFSLDSIPVNQRWGYYQEHLSPFFYHIYMGEGLVANEIYMHEKGYSFNELGLLSVRLPPVISARSKKKADVDGHNYFTLGLNLSGEFQLRISGEEICIRQNDIFLLDYSQPLQYWSASGYHELMLIIPCNRMYQIHPYPADLHGLVLRKEEVGNQILSRHLHTLFTHASEMGKELGWQLVKPTMDLLSAVLANLTPGKDKLHGTESYLLLSYRVIACIRRNLNNPSLSLDFISQDLKVSRSQIYRAFESRGGVAEFIRNQRLKEVYRDLSNPFDQASTTKEIAFRWGFEEYRSFRRTFKQFYGVVPSEVKNQFGAAVNGIADATVSQLKMPFSEMWIS
jgi:AraC-like DNA-binding protein